MNLFFRLSNKLRLGLRLDAFLRQYKYYNTSSITTDRRLYTSLLVTFWNVVLSNLTLTGSRFSLTSSKLYSCTWSSIRHLQQMSKGINITTMQSMKMTKGKSVHGWVSHKPFQWAWTINDTFHRTRFLAWISRCFHHLHSHFAISVPIPLRTSCESACHVICCLDFMMVCPMLHYFSLIWRSIGSVSDPYISIPLM